MIVSTELNDDVLLIIFDIVSEQIPDRSYTKERPHDVVRAASQVCRRWRQVLLASPWIWGRLLDLGRARYGMGKRKWLEEVLGRAGSASALWISGTVMRSTQSSLFDAEAYFIRLLELWERVEKVVVEIRGFQVQEDIKARFSSRAPKLKVFDVYFSVINHTWDHDTLNKNPQTLFANHAPLLESINANQLAFRVDTPWLSNVRSITLSTKTVNVADLFSLLQHTPRLEDIAVSEPWQVDWESQQLPQRISLSKLSCISLESTLPFATVFLDRVAPRRLSKLRLVLSRSAFSYAPIEPPLKTSLQFYISSYFTTKTSTTISLAVSDDKVRLLDITPFYTKAPGHVNFDIQIIKGHLDYLSDDFIDRSDTLLSTIFDTLTPSSGLDGSLFQSVTRLQLIFEGDRWAIPSLSRKLSSMLAIFPHVEEITTSASLKFILTLWRVTLPEDQPDVLFPALHTLYLTSDNFRADSGQLVKFLKKLLERRKGVGHPLAKLILTGKFNSDQRQHFESLYSIEGLEIVL